MNFTFSPELAKTLFSVSLTILIALLVDHFLRSLIKVPKHFDTRRARTLIAITRNSITVIIYVIALNIILVELGLNITPILASAGIVGVAIGLGARTLIEDLIAGVLLLSQNTITIGDFVKIDDAEGVIEQIGFRSLTIRADTGALYSIPNGQVKRVINYSRHKVRMQIDIPVKSDHAITSVLKATEEALSLLTKERELASFLAPGSTINGIEEFKAGGPLLIRATIVTYPAKRQQVAMTFRYLIKKTFEKNKIEFG